MKELKDAVRRKSSFFATMKAVFWSFFGVRKKSAYEKDVEKLNPVHVIIAGVLAAVVFVVVLILIVKSVVH
jgi:hypothetical protein